MCSVCVGTLQRQPYCRVKPSKRAASDFTLHQQCPPRCAINIGPHACAVRHQQLTHHKLHCDKGIVSCPQCVQCMERL